MSSKYDVGTFVAALRGSTVCSKEGACASSSDVFEQTSQYIDRMISLHHDGIADIFDDRVNVNSDLGSMYRCRGMIQEIYNEVIMYNANLASLFRESSGGGEIDADGEGATRLLEAQLLYVLPVPGHTSLYETHPMAGRASDVGAGHDGTALDAVNSASCDHPMPSSPTADMHRKRTREYDEGQASLVPPESPQRPRRDADSCAENRTQKAESSVAALLSPEEYLNYPLRSDTGHNISPKGCVVTVLRLRNRGDETGDGDHRLPYDLHVNDVVDFFGYVHFPDDQISADDLEDDMMQFSAWGPMELSRGKVSRLLCVSCCPVATCPLTSKVLPAITTPLESLRMEALRYLRQSACGGDELAAHYALLHLCSTVRFHTDSTPVGDVPLLLSGGLSASAVSASLRPIVPVAEVLMTRQLLASACAAGRLTPVFDVDRNFLRSGALQLANGSHVTLDADALAAGGEWDDALFSLIHRQLLPLQYPFQRLEIPINLSFLAVSSGAGTSVHKCHDFAMRVPVLQDPPAVCDGDEEEEAAATTTATTYMGDSLSNAARSFFAQARATPFGSAPDRDRGTELQKLIEGSIADFSARHVSWHNRDPFIHNNTISVVNGLIRAYAFSFGRSFPTEDDVHAVFALEHQRMQRLH